VYLASIAIWLALLAAPSITTFSSTSTWDVAPLGLFAANLWAVGLAWTLAGRRWFFLLTYPLALFGAFSIGADLIRNANLLELLLVGATNAHEIGNTLKPYIAPALIVASILLTMAIWPAFVHPPEKAGPARSRMRWTAAALVAAGATFAATAPAIFVRAWPINIVTLAIAKATGRADIVSTTLPYAAVNPRDPHASWNARRASPGPGVDETYVLVIGESVRSDRLKACGNPRDVTPAANPLLVFCDVTSGSSSTHTSVPLLVSRENPGQIVRVSRDATFMKAFEQAGFQTSWLSVQDAQIAWPDGQSAQYLAASRTDAASLSAPFRKGLQAPSGRKLIVVHAYNAHFNYCDRYEQAHALVKVDCAKFKDSLPSVDTRSSWLGAYDNATQESMRFIDELIETLKEQRGEVFLLYTPDHGENLLDDDRELFQHALAFPTRWDTRVPAIVWANDSWRSSHRGQWEQLVRNLRAPLTHGDVVPTLLGAASIDYEEPRTTVADLTRRKPPKRVRWVQKSLGAVVDGDKL
jgi:glucan phosphoethanolaminetransferase (alkaline phosphatase superfamily)